jgi:hypothetical protein
MHICDVLQVAPAWLFEGAPVPKPKASAAAREMDAAFADFLADDTAPNLILVWPRLPARLKRRVSGLLLQFIDQAS